jgi:carboxymethylenebutenolidase
MPGTELARQETAMTAAVLARQMLRAQWHQHMCAQFGLKDADAALETMTDSPHVFCVPSGRGAAGRAGVREFYAKQFLPGIPRDLELRPISEIFADEHVAAEHVMRFTHTLQMDWMLPGVPPTGRSAELLLVTITRFENGKIASEHLYWDAASLLFQLRLVNSAAVAAGIKSPAKLLKRAAQDAIGAEPLTLLA